MADVDYEEEATIVFTSEVVGGVMTLKVSSDPAVPGVTIGCGDLVTDICDRDNVSAVKLRVKDDPGGRTSRVYSSGVAGQWARLPTSGPTTHSQTTISVPVAEGAQTVLGLVIYLDDPNNGGPALRRTQVVIIRHEPA